MASKGRPAGLQLDPDRPGPIAQAVVQGSGRGRFRLPADVVRGATWLGSTEAMVESLVVFEDPGYLVLLPWSPDGDRVIARRRELIASINEKSESEEIEALRVLEDRYKRVKIGKDLRVTLSPEMLQHLRLQRETAAQVYVVRVQDRIELISPDTRDRRLASGHPALDDLP